MASLDKTSELSLSRLVHLALSSSPQVGIVNFNLLKTFLLELLKALNVQHYEPKFSDDSDIKNLLNDAIQSEKQNEKYMNIVKESEDNKEERPSSGFSLLTSDLKPLSFERFKRLEDRFARFEQQMAALNSLPTNQQIIDKVKDVKKSSGPILEIWQYTQLSKRLESNEEGITKLTSLVQDLISEINELKENQTKNDGDIKKLNEHYKDLLNRINSFDKTVKSLPSTDQLKNLEDELEALKKLINNVDKFDDKLNNVKEKITNVENKIYNVVTHPDLELYVTWPSLENSLKGLKDALDSALRREPVVNEETQTMAVREKSSREKSRIETATSPIPQKQETKHETKHETKQETKQDKSFETFTINEQNYIKEKTSSYEETKPRPSSHHPSKELKEILSKLGTLNERHEVLKDIVDQLRLEIAKRPVGSGQLQSFRLPDDFGDKMEEIKRLKALIEELKKNFSDEANKRGELENMMYNLNNSLDNIRNSLKDCLKNIQLNKDEIMGLKEAIRMLDETKADKSWIKSEFERKADKRDLDQKIGKKIFDEQIQEISNTVHDCKQKTVHLEDDVKKVNENVFKELENKLDRLELDGLKDYIERQMKKFKKLQKENIQPIQTGPSINPEDDAAGLRRQLLRFHCISCDRPIDMPAQNAAYPSLPAEKGMRPIQTPRPYTTYELDQIRQFQRQQYLTDTSYDLFSSARQCGGAHTLTVPHKKMVKIASTTVEEVVNQPVITQRNEVQLQGQDGHIYKGRIDARLPVDLKRQVKNSNKNHMNNSYQNLRSISDKDTQDESVDKLPVFTN